MKDNNFIMISGPAASGKSTLVYKMKKELSGFVFKPSLAYIELAKIMVFQLIELFLI